ncbi:MAG: UvrD-helicase domain-containing protein, partial [Chitinispirillaceae bacterium]|nr:UvrD-helicase domain-containing protein [Chitinispirillaceae bacterium]
AGTGKTKTLIAKLAVLVKSGVPASRILAITFTNKAAEEMKRRVSAIVPQASGLWCGTFHSFGARFLRMHYDKVGLKKDFVIYDEDDQKKLLSVVIKDLGFDKEKIKSSVYLSL